LVRLSVRQSEIYWNARQVISWIIYASHLPSHTLVVDRVKSTTTGRSGLYIYGRESRTHRNCFIHTPQTCTNLNFTGIRHYRYALIRDSVDYGILACLIVLDQQGASRVSSYRIPFGRVLIFLLGSRIRWKIERKRGSVNRLKVVELLIPISGIYLLVRGPLKMKLMNSPTWRELDIAIYN
jgi:hypothetical protein